MFRLVRLLALAALFWSSVIGVAAQATPEVAAAAGHLVVADSAAHALYAFGLDDLALEDTLDGVTVNGHAGFLALPDGRLLFVDEETEELVAVQVSDTGIDVVGRVPVPSPVSHFAVNPAVTHVVVGASDPVAPLTFVDLDSYTSRSFAVEAGEAGVMLGGETPPSSGGGLGGESLTIFHRNDALMQVESYPVEAIARGSTTPTGIVDTGAFGHGEAIDHERGRLYLATDDGFDVVDVVPEGLAYHATLPWDASRRSGGRAYFARITPDGNHLISYIANREAAETDWETWENDVYLIDLGTEEARRVELAPGLVYRFGLSELYALFFNIHPDGDNALLVDADSASPTFGEVVATIPLAPLSDGPRADESPWEAESRIAAITPDGATGFVSHGGDGVISVIDTAARQVTGQIDVPTPLSGGGYMIVLQDNMPLTDTIAR
jgi:hypothetical protein